MRRQQGEEPQLRHQFLGRFQASVHENAGPMWIGDTSLMIRYAPFRLGVGDPKAEGGAGQVLVGVVQVPALVVAEGGPSVIRYCKSRICGRSMVG